MKEFKGKAYFLNRENINTDEMIPAKYLNEISKEALKDHLFEDLKLENFNPLDPKLKEASILITKENFGCGSSREHAIYVLEVNKINVVIAPSFARIFRQNMFNNGLLATELPKEEIDQLFENQDKISSAEIDLQEMKIKFEGYKEISFNLLEFEKTLIKEEGLLGFVLKRY